MADFTVHFYEEAPAGARQKYAVIIAKHEGKLLWCRHQDRTTWEVPGGHIEEDETAIEAAARELQEETGAVNFTLTPVCWYSAFCANSEPHSVGLLCTAEVHSFGELHSEISEVQPFDVMPSNLTYPQIQPFLLEEARRRGVI